MVYYNVVHLLIYLCSIKKNPTITVHIINHFRADPLLGETRIDDIEKDIDTTSKTKPKAKLACFQEVEANYKNTPVSTKFVSSAVYIVKIKFYD